MYHFYKGFHSHLNIKGIEFLKVFEDIRCLESCGGRNLNRQPPVMGGGWRIFASCLRLVGLLLLISPAQRFARGYTSDELRLHCVHTAATCRVRQVDIDGSHVMGLPKVLISWETYYFEEVRISSNVKRVGRGQKSADVELLALLQRQQKVWKIEVLGKLYFFLTSGKISDTDTY